MTEITAKPLIDRLRELLKFKYMGDCKCGNCQLVPYDLLEKTIQALATPPASGSPAGVPEGWVLVPEKPWPSLAGYFREMGGSLDWRWAQALAAAPSPPVHLDKLDGSPPVPAQDAGVDEALEKCRSALEAAIDLHGPDPAGAMLSAINAADRALSRQATASGRAGEDDAALTHLGSVLYWLSDLHPDDRCVALDKAQTFYNSRVPDNQIGPSGLPLQRLADQPRPSDDRVREALERLRDNGLSNFNYWEEGYEKKEPGLCLSLAKEKMAAADAFVRNLATATLQSPARSGEGGRGHSGFDCNNTDSPGGDPSPM